LANGVGLLGCPQLLDDDFGTSHGLPDRDAGICLDGRCELPFSGWAGSAGDAGGDDGGSAGASAGGEAGAGGNAGSSGAAGSGGSSGSSAGSGGSAGASGSAGAAGSAGSAGAAGTGGSAGAGGTGTGVDACWTLELTGNDDGQQSNCLDIHGWNNIQQDTGTMVALSYQDGDPCFVGTVSNASTGWGAVYIMTFADSEADPSSTWNATSHNVTGFDFVYRGSKQPASLKVIYKDPGGTDFCEVIAPGEVAVPFADTTNCGNGSGSAVDTTQLSNITFAFPVSSQSYQVDFCMQISARN
jgi:hypothetical protein